MHVKCGLWIVDCGVDPMLSPEAFSYMSKWIYSTNKCKMYAVQMNRFYARIRFVIIKLYNKCKTNVI